MQQFNYNNNMNNYYNNNLMNVNTNQPNSILFPSTSSTTLLKKK